MLTRENLEKDILEGLTNKKLANKYKVSRTTIINRKKQWGLVGLIRKSKTKFNS
jgi:transposase